MKSARILAFRRSSLPSQRRRRVGCRAFCLSSSVRLDERLSLVDGAKVKGCYQVLGVSDESSTEEVKEAYVRLAKQYHPDCQTQFANANRFVDIEEAYRTIMNHRKEKSGKSGRDFEEATTTFDIKHTAPQHRQYLTFDGVGYGSPSQRQHQYQQRKVMQAVDTVFEYRTQQISALHENAMVTKDKKETRKRTIRNAIDRLVEDLIAESMAKGDFDNLPGAGKPLANMNHNPYIDTTTHNLNRILINSGYLPPWVTLEKEIRQMMSQARDDLLKAAHPRHTADNKADKGGRRPAALSSSSSASSSARAKQKNWSRKVREFDETIKSINLKINELNMIVPTLRQQMFHYNTEREIKQILRCYDDDHYDNDHDDSDDARQQKSSCSANDNDRFTFHSSFSSSCSGWAGKEERDEEGKTIGRHSADAEDRMTLNIVLRELKALFKQS